MSRARPSQNAQLNAIARTIAQKLPDDSGIAMLRYQLGLLVEADLDHLDDRWLQKGTAILATAAKPFRRLRQAGIDIPPPTSLIGMLGYVVSFGPDEDPPADTVEAIAQVARRRARSQPGIADRNMAVVACKVMGGPTGRALRTALADGEHQVWPKALGTEPFVCPLSCDGGQRSAACVCAGGAMPPGGRRIGYSTQTVEVRIGREDAADVGQHTPEAANRGQTRPTATEPVEVEDPRSTMPEAKVSPGIKAAGDSVAEPVTEPYFEPTLDVPRPRRTNRNRVQTIGSPIRPGRGRR